MRKLYALLAIVFLLCQCADGDGFATYIAGPASKVTRTQSLASAFAYTQVRWTACKINIRHATGIDCSCFVSRCWRPERPVSSAEFSSITLPISCHELKPVDILLTKGHDILFDRWLTDGCHLIGDESGPLPAWKVSCNHFPVKKLLNRGYAPRRYFQIIEPSS